MRSLSLPLFYFEVKLDLSWIKDCVLVKHINSIAGIDFKIASTKLYVAVVTFSLNDKIKCLDKPEART